LGDFLPIGQLFTLASSLKTTEVAHTFWPLVSEKKLRITFLHNFPLDNTLGLL
jgi:hypothetical protein